MVNVLATILFFIVFVELFVALTLYIAVTIYRFYREWKKSKEEVS